VEISNHKILVLLTRNKIDFICKSEARKESKKFDRDYENFLNFLLIHGMVHLKGFDHSSTMESIESKFRKKFGV
jgi:ssRNA-specific RNase YbeY (16S rRNA maturation enzyme)